MDLIRDLERYVDWKVSTVRFQKSGRDEFHEKMLKTLSVLTKLYRKEWEGSDDPKERKDLYKLIEENGSWASFHFHQLCRPDLEMNENPLQRFHTFEKEMKLTEKIFELKRVVYRRDEVEKKFCRYYNQVPSGFENSWWDGETQLIIFLQKTESIRRMMKDLKKSYKLETGFTFDYVYS